MPGGQPTANANPPVTRPATLTSTDITVGTLLEASLSEGTRQAYRRAWQQLREFHTVHKLDFKFPVSGHILTQFIAYMHNKKYAAASITSVASAISFVHKLVGAADPGNMFLVKKVLQGCRKLKRTVDSRLPITQDILSNLLQASQQTISSQFTRCRFNAMCTVAFSALLRVGEMTSSANNLEFESVCLGGDAFNIVFHKYKHSNGLSSRHQVLASPSRSTCPLRAMKAYLDCRGSQPGALFLTEAGEAVPRQTFCSELRVALEFCGYPPHRYTSHSFRIGAASHMAVNGASDSQIRQAGRWSSDAFHKYIRINQL